MTISIHNYDFYADQRLVKVIDSVRVVAQLTDTDVYLVGGPVRDLILGRPVTDLDFVVIGDGIAFAKLFSDHFHLKKLVIYERFGTAMVPFHKFQIEFVGARSESYHASSRNPVVSKAGLEDDLARRDFTINALAIPVGTAGEQKVVDLFEGLADLDKRILRTPLPPAETFHDDPLRILRAIRFAAQLNFEIAPDTWSGICAMRERLEIITVERIAEEFKKLLMGDFAVRGLQLLHEAKLHEWIIPELASLAETIEKNGHRHKEILPHTLEVVDNVISQGADFELRLAALLHDIAKPETRHYDDEKGWTFYGHAEKGAEMTQDILRRLRYGNNLVDRVSQLVALHQRPGQLAREAEPTPSAYRRLLFDAGDLFGQLIKLSRADISTRIPGKKELLLGRLESAVAEMLAVDARDSLSRFRLAVTGQDIMEITGLRPGKKIGEIKQELEEMVVSGLVENEREVLLAYIAEHSSNWETRRQ